MKRLLASDVDGTLYLDQKIHEKSLEYIKKFRNNGDVFLLSTGRNFAGVKSLIKEYDLEIDGLVLCNGGVVLDKDLKSIYSEELDDNIIKSIFEECKDKNKYNFYFGDQDHIYIIDGYFNNPIFSASDMEEKMNIVKIQEKDFYNNSYKANIIGVEVRDKSIESTQDKINDIEAKLNDKISIYRNKYFIDIVGKDVSKANGISKVLDYYNVKEDDVYVIGDSWNDLSMFKKFKNSYTFSYAEEELKPHASNIVDLFHNCLEDMIKIEK